MSQNPYYSFISNNNYMRQFPHYENSYRELALSLVPWDRFVEDFENLDLNLKKEVDKLDYCLIRMLEWFKSHLFTWVNSLNCEKCDQECLLIECRQTSMIQFNCFTIEIYKCLNCDSFYQFPRYNHGGKLLQTKRGRCGEWALAFAYLCFVWSYEIRMVSHFDDHVWIEVYSRTKQRWVHCDPCENAYDNPLMYECGWKKRSSLIIAYGMHEVRDVTWRYVSRWRNTVEYRKQLFDENQIIAILDRLNSSLQSKMNQSQRDLINERWLAELTEFIRTPDQEVIEAEPKALQGRISGSIQWRLSRGETQIQTKHVFHLNSNSQLSESKKQMTISYDCCQDSYIVKSDPKEMETIISQWNAACYESENVFRMVENDWKMCYLSRNQHCTHEDIGRIRWRIELNGLTKWKWIEILIKGQTFESGVIQLEFRYKSFHRQFNINEVFRINYEDLWSILKEDKCQSVPCFQIEARLMFGNGQVAWQHAQLFRQTIRTKDRNDMFRIIIESI